ncbi:MAG: hypothetical protein H6707_13910 [Deltaproteobacteria bacterium]|nr:hypothetical protein [Deltaproteobacteria bacterium]
MKRLLATAVLLSCVGCIPTTSREAFTQGADEIPCSATYPVCRGKFAGCRLANDSYISGTFPGSRKVVAETPPGDFKLQLRIYLDDRLSAGTDTEVLWYEPGCSEIYRYQLSKDGVGGRDLFEIAGNNQVFSVTQRVVDAGDHLVEVFSDATASYLLRVDVIQ